MALTFIPTVWAARLLTALEKTLVYGQAQVANREYEGDIREAGNAVKIASIGDVTIGDYTKNTDIDDPEVLTDAQQTLNIDQAKYFNFFVDSIDRAQQNVNVLDEAMRRSAWALRDAADSYLAGIIEAAVPTGNKIGSVATPVVPTSENAYEYLVDLGVLLDEANAPIEGRFVVVPAWFHGLLLKDDRFTGAGTLRSDRRLANGQVGEAAGFSILKSNNVPNDAGEAYRIVAGHSVATAYVEQILDLQAFKPEKRFGDAVKGLHVYGAKAVRPAALAMLIADKA
ncbi:MAG TPA: P22 phage major capsid protein family protein [Pyrinomonadaceae bacterium]|nr:P22 coat protein - protein 5 domain protein [Chloracidobacterium sp.]HRJ87648.1 P22 phage major capsid protein family protein [Pyrinomonadaceae bacterium]HRK51948.1 P22 phage major capsid protein family protein [Pyrinomonadaceae bacterium]